MASTFALRLSESCHTGMAVLETGLKMGINVKGQV